DSSSCFISDPRHPRSKLFPYTTLFRSQRKVDSLREVEKRTVVKETPKEKKQQSYEDQRKLKSLNNKLSSIEAEISQLEKDIKAIDLSLEVNYHEVTSQLNFFDNYQKKKAKLKEAMQKWEDIQLEIDQY